MTKIKIMDFEEIILGKSTLEKYRLLLIMIYKETVVSDLNSSALNLLQNSFFEAKLVTNGLPNSYTIEIITDPLAFAKAKQNLFFLESNFQKELRESVGFYLYNVVIKPDLDKIHLLPSPVEPVKTTWEKVNQDQVKLIDLLRKSTDGIDYRNIGNTARSLLHHLAVMVYDPIIHNRKGLVTKGEKFKNQLSEFIGYELEGQSNKELRRLAESSVRFVCDSIDLMNKTTHKLEANKHLAELCVIGAISTVRIITIISELTTESTEQ